MTSLDLDLIASQIEDLDSTELTKDDDEEDATEMTIDDEEEVRMDADSTDTTQDKFNILMYAEETDSTVADKISLDADHTDMTKDADDTEATVTKFRSEATEDTQDKFKGIGQATNPKIPASEIIVRDIAVETAPLAALPADSDAAFGQWLAGSGFPSLN